jgi:eukaryotic-like serine/threonine-protein kinase
MIFVLILLAVVAAFLLWKAPTWAAYAVLGVSLLMTAWMVSSSWGQPTGERSVLPLLVYALALGLLVPLRGLGGAGRVAPSKNKAANSKKKDGATGMQVKGDVMSSLEAIDIPGYEVLEKVGSGGMASVFRAKRKSDGQVVAMKIPMEQYVQDAKFIRRFHREAEVAQSLDHPNIVKTYEHGSMGVKHYMAMEFVDGRSLEGYIEGGDMTAPLAVEVMKSVVRALQHIHVKGIIHRDIKPANIMLLKDAIKSKDPLVFDPNSVKLMDFGIAGGKILTRLTMTGARVGTPIYMSPEQARGLKIDYRSDIYSLGLVFYEMLTGQTAFKGGYEAIVHQQIFQTPPPPRQLNLAIPKTLDTLIMRMIAKDADERPKLSEVLEILDKGDTGAEDNSLDLPSRIVLTVSSRQGVLRILDPQGSLHTSLGNIGVGEGSFSAAPLSVSVDSAGNFLAAIFEYRVGSDNHRMIHKLDPSGKALTSFGAYGMKPGEFLYPISLSVSPDDRTYVLDSETHLAQAFDSSGNYLFNFGGRGEGRGTFNDPRVITVAADGSVYVLDYGNRQIQRFDASGRYQTRWAFKMGAGQDGMRIIDGFTVDGGGNLYVSDATGGKVRKITPQGRVEVSYAIDPLQGEATDTLLDLGVDDRGYLYASRRGGHLIRKYDTAGRLMETMETYAPVVQMVVDVKVGVPA